MFIKIVIVLVMFGILFALARGLFYLVKDGSQTKRIARALTWRIGLSVVLFLFLFVAFYFHWIEPHGVAG